MIVGSKTLRRRRGKDDRKQNTLVPLDVTRKETIEENNGYVVFK
jgi:hypothetical protein